MTSRLRTSIASAAALAGVGALVITTPVIGVQVEMSTASMAAMNSLDTPYELLSKSNGQGSNAGAYADDDDDDDDDDYGNGNGNGHDDDDDDDDDDDEGGIGNIGNFVADFLAANQAEVLAVTAMIPVFYLGPVALGDSLLATAYYDGYNGSAPGLEGVVSYVTSQFGVPPTDIVEGLVLGLTSLVPQFNVGPVAVGNSLLATAYFDGYNGSGTGLPGVISYVTSQLGLQAPPGAAVPVGPAAAVAQASDSAPAAVAVSRVAVAAPAAAQDSDEQTTAADAVQVSASADDSDSPVGSADQSTDATTASPPSGGRGSASAKAGSAHSKTRSERSAAKAASRDD